MLSNRAASTVLSTSNLGSSAKSVTATAAATATATIGPPMPLSNEHLYSTLYGRELELMRKIYKGENRDHLVENPLMHSSHQQHNQDAMLMKNAVYPMNYTNSVVSHFGVGQYHHALSPSRTSPKLHHPEEIMSPDNVRMIKQEEKPMHFNSPSSNYPGYGVTSMTTPTSILSNLPNPIARKFDPETIHKQMYDDRKFLNAGGFIGKDHHHQQPQQHQRHHHHNDHSDLNYNLYGDIMSAANNNNVVINNFLHLQSEHDKQSHRHQQHHNTTKHNNTGQLIGSESNNHFYNINEYESNDSKRQLHQSSHQLFPQNQFSINNTPKDNGGVNNPTSLTERSTINTTTSELNNACSHSDNNNNNNNNNSNSNSNNDNAKNVRLTSKFSGASNANENSFENPCRPAKMCAKSIKSEGTSKINPTKVNNATNSLSHSKCDGNETTNDFMLHIRVKEQKHRMKISNGGRMAQQMDFDETSNSCSSPRNCNESASNCNNDDEGDEFMNL